MSKRHRDALAVIAGACNPGAIARSIVSACDELNKEGAGTDQTCNDPAVRLMVYQLGWITKAGDMPLDEYLEAEKFCQENQT